MTLIKALETLKEKGVNKLIGLEGKTDINDYITNAIESHEISLKHADVPCHKYSLDHENDYFIVAINGYHIIAKHFENFDMAIYGDYSSEEEMYMAFSEWKIKRDAEAIADKIAATRPGEMPREAWIMIAASELRRAHKAATEAFNREYGKV